MASLSIRKLDDDVYARLQMKANKDAISMEEEVRRILARAVALPQSISNIFTENFGKNNGVDFDQIMEEEQKPHLPLDFSA